jgi:hypothetical protein
MDGFSTETEKVAARLYALTLERGTSEMLAWIDGYQYDGGYVFANKGAVAYLKDEIPELRGRITEEKVYFILPEKLSQREDLLDDIKLVWELDYNGTYESEIITYKGSPGVVAVTQGKKVSSTLVSSPLIVLNNMGADGVPGYRGIGYLHQATMFKLTPEELDAYQTELGYPDVPPQMTNVLENYRYQWQFEKRTLLIAAVLMALVLMLEGIVLMTILRFEYRVYATELALKKVFGHTLYDRNRRIILTTAITGTLGLVASLVVCKLLGTSSPGSVAIGGVMLLALELVFAMLNAARIERRNIQRILKGEAV